MVVVKVKLESSIIFGERHISLFWSPQRVNDVRQHFLELCVLLCSFLSIPFSFGALPLPFQAPFCPFSFPLGSPFFSLCMPFFLFLFRFSALCFSPLLG